MAMVFTSGEMEEFSWALTSMTERAELVSISGQMAEPITVNGVKENNMALAFISCLSQARLVSRSRKGSPIKTIKNK